MALYNNKYWLLSHIRNSFISTDDTGMCEIIMEGQSLPKHLVEALNTYPDSEDSQDEEDFNQNDSGEIQLELDLPVRQRSDTAVRLERMDMAKKRAAKTKHIKWEPQANVPLQFTQREAVHSQSPPVPVKSLLSHQIVNCTNLPQNPYIQYAKFDGSAQVGIPIRKYRIFLTILPEEQRNYPMTVVCVATAKIEDLVGLICFKCSTAHGDFPLQPVTHYGLYITEEDGEVDRDFPALDAKECVAKFGFTCLGLVEERYSKRLSFESDDADATDGDAEKRHAETEIVSQEDAKQDCAGMRLLLEHTTAMEAPLYKSYRVYVIYRMRAKVEIQLGITGDKIEIDPVRQKSSKFKFNRHKPVSHSMDSIASCDIVDTKSSKSVFRVVYSPSSVSFSLELPASSSTFHMSSSFKHYDFETDHATAEDIVQKVNMILEIRSSASRKEYLDLQAKKNTRAKNFPLSKSNSKW